MITRPLVMMGTGRIARAFLGQLLRRTEYLRQRYALAMPVAVIANSRYLTMGDPFLDPEDIRRIIDHGLSDGESIEANPAGFQSRLVADLAPSGLTGAVVLDLTASDGMTSVHLSALESGADVVLANKKPLCEDYETFVRLTTHPRGRIGYEATVGAGLPIVQTLRALADTGDELVDLMACLSGTLGYLCTHLEDGQPLSAIVREARDRGFTEPDPREDLSGADVRRKALILARTMGLPLEADDIPAAPMIPLDEGPVEAWLAGLTQHDAVMAARSEAASEQGLVLRYAAHVLPDGCEVGLREVPRVSAVGRLRGTDNILIARTRFYDERPLNISGPGAGPEVTAAGVFGDLLRLACVG